MSGHAKHDFVFRRIAQAPSDPQATASLLRVLPTNYSDGLRDLLAQLLEIDGETPPLPCVSTAFVAKTPPSPCVSTALVAKTVTLALCFYCLGG